MPSLASGCGNLGPMIRLYGEGSLLPSMVLRGICGVLKLPQGCMSAGFGKAFVNLSCFLGLFSTRSTKGI